MQSKICTMHRTSWIPFPKLISAFFLASYFPALFIQHISSLIRVNSRLAHATQEPVHDSSVLARLDIHVLCRRQ